MYKIIKQAKVTGVEEVFEGFNTPDEASEFMKVSKFGTKDDTEFEYFLQSYITEEELKKTTVIGGGYSYLYGYVDGERVIVSNTLEQICAFILKHRMEDVQLVSLFDEMEIETSMGFLNYCNDQEFRNELVSVLAPMQQGLKEIPGFVHHQIKGEYILNQVRMESEGRHMLMSVDFDGGSIQPIEQESDVYLTEEALIEAHPDSQSWETALLVAMNNDWLEKE